MDASIEAERPVKGAITVTQTRDICGVDQGVSRGSNEKLSDYENILKKGSTGCPNKLDVQGKGKRILIDDSKVFGLSN